MLVLEDILDVPSFDDEFTDPTDVCSEYDYWNFDW